MPGGGVLPVWAIAALKLAKQNLVIRPSSPAARTDAWRIDAANDRLSGTRLVERTVAMRGAIRFRRRG